MEKNDLTSKVGDLIYQELQAINEKSELFRSTHEGAAFIYEQVGDCLYASRNLKEGFEGLWKQVISSSDNDIKTVDLLETEALNLACSAIRVAAMCKKYSMSTYYQKMLEEGTNR
jgi:hypothetical protein